MALTCSEPLYLIGNSTYKKEILMEEKAEKETLWQNYWGIRHFKILKMLLTRFSKGIVALGKI